MDWEFFNRVLSFGLPLILYGNLEQSLEGTTGCFADMFVSIYTRRLVGSGQQSRLTTHAVAAEQIPPTADASKLEQSDRELDFLTAWCSSIEVYKKASCHPAWATRPFLMDALDKFNLPLPI